MGPLASLYRPSLALLTDLYQLTMALGYWKAGLHRHEAVFHLFFRDNPFGGGFAIACGLATAIEYLEAFHFDDSDLTYLASLRGADGCELFEPAFLEFLRHVPLDCHIDAIPEGTVVFPHEPLLRVTGPLLQAQLIETALLNLIGFPTLVATKAARLVLASRGEPVIEFGLRRAQGIDGAVAASRAAYVGGCESTSNVLAGQLYGIPVRGTHAHSWVMCFDNELDAFRAYAKAMPNNCVFLVDTYDSLQGVRNAVEVGKWLRSTGQEMLGVRLDSGDLAYLSTEARKILDEGGFPNAAILASNDLDEFLVGSLKEQGAAINRWGVGTRLATAYDDPALGNVYKLSAIRSPGGPWQDRVKVSEQAAKATIPGILQVRRYRRNGKALGDAIFDIHHPPAHGVVIVDPSDPIRRKLIPNGAPGEDLLVPIFRGGKQVYQTPSLDETRRRVQDQLATFHSGVKRFVNPHRYPAGLEAGLHEHRTQLVLKAKGFS